MLIPWNIANQQENKCSLHAASKKDNSPPLRAVHCTVQSKLLFNFRVTMFNSLWPFVQNRTRRFCIRTNHRYWIKAGISSPTKSFLSCNHRLHCSQSGQARKEHTGRLERDVLFFCFFFGFGMPILQYQAQYLCETKDRGWMIKNCKRHSGPNYWGP